jgi:hypothetical protein
MNITYSGLLSPYAYDEKKLFYLDEKNELCFNIVNRTPGAIAMLIARVEKHLHTLPKKELEVTHTFIDGIYTRSLFIPKGVILVGKTHLKDCVNIVAKGDITVLTKSGLGRIKAGHIATSKAGIQKLGYAHEDTVFINVFRTDKTNIKEVESEISVDSIIAQEAQGIKLCQ